MSPLPAALNLLILAAIASGVSTALAAFAPVINKIPGLRPSDSTRTILLRMLVALLNLAAVVGYAFLSNIVIPKDAVITLLGAVLGQTGWGHMQYLALSAAHAVSSPVAATPATAPARTLDPSTALAELNAATQQATAASA